MVKADKSKKKKKKRRNRDDLTKKKTEVVNSGHVNIMKTSRDPDLEELESRD